MRKPLVLIIVFVLGATAGAILMPINWHQVQTLSPEVSNQPDPASQVSPPRADRLDPDFFHSALPESREINDLIPIMGRLAFNAENIHLVSARIAGRLDRILVFEGVTVKQGQPVAALYSPEYISAQNELLLARNTWRTLQGSKATQELAEDAESTLQSARERMKVMGASDQDIRQLEQTGKINEHLLLRAPISGVVTVRNMDPGAFINLGDSFMSIADVSTLWFYGNVYEQDYASIKLGQGMQLNVQALPGQVYAARVDLIAPSVDSESNTLRVRCRVTNDGRLRPDMFATASLNVGKRQALLVPADAIIRSLQVDYIIVEMADGHFRKRQVTTMPYQDGLVAIVQGLNAGEKVVVRGATLLNQTLSGAA
ncbi:efflux RND transporter periplasmic adaptor subunit [Methylobacillus gramineus]|uniref:efflux RND transporter periplasmic adaptor subunit n=1 Tax=Methylobacillus gramineus TaxID=755169 RepID=UPI001CFFC191|nr:efflux RND transporter periplasmic adaptor subunit [Methylobacillus gramineus]MCB5184222.1 efflux RND transporter periplasmic adaptor subunit [Methylobacillus gramineus]